MSKRHVEEYYIKMTSDYTEMKNVLEELQKSVTEENASAYAAQISTIKEQVRLLEANYKRLSYIMFLLNMPNKKKKESGYNRREHKKLDNIPDEHRAESVHKENSDILDNIKNINNES